MKDEIKEILECIKDKKRDYVGTNGCLYQDLDRKELNLLLDYITNLQEQLHQASLDIQELTEKDIGCPSWCDKLTNLQEENERLHKELDYANNDNIYYIAKIDKAIDKLYCYGEVFDREILKQFQKEMLNILNGDDEE